MEEAGYQEIPMIKKVTAEMVEENYRQIKQEIFDLLKTECALQEVRAEVKETGKRANSRSDKGMGEEQGVSR